MKDWQIEEKRQDVRRSIAEASLFVSQFAGAADRGVRALAKRDTPAAIDGLSRAIHCVGVAQNRLGKAESFAYLLDVQEQRLVTGQIQEMKEEIERLAGDLATDITSLA